MPESNNNGRSGREGTAKTLLVATLVSLVCSVFVASAAVILKPRQEANEILNMRRNILEVADLLEPDRDIDELFEDIETRVVDLETGTYNEEIDPAQFDALKAARDPELGVRIPKEQDLAGIGRRARLATVYLVKEDGIVTAIILPVHGYGLWSTMYGFIALEPDGNTVSGLRFYEHAETPGLGDQIDKAAWLDLWPGKKVLDEAGELRLEVIKGRVPPGDALKAHRIDGIAGATLTGRGVSRLLRYWLGDDGYGPYLSRIQNHGGES